MVAALTFTITVATVGAMVVTIMVGIVTGVDADKLGATTSVDAETVAAFTLVNAEILDDAVMVVAETVVASALPVFVVALAPGALLRGVGRTFFVHQSTVLLLQAGLAPHCAAEDRGDP